MKSDNGRLLQFHFWPSLKIVFRQIREESFGREFNSAYLEPW